MRSLERASDDFSNNVTYQRCLYAYEHAKQYILGKKVLDVGCGLAYGTTSMSNYALDITGIDYDRDTIEINKNKHKQHSNIHFQLNEVPPITQPDEFFDVVTVFQFIEHIHDRKSLLREAQRVLKKGGILLLTTPNIKKSLARNPFHVHEYTFDEMRKELSDIFTVVELSGLKGDEKVNKYYTENSKWVAKLLRWDILRLHKTIPSLFLKRLYNIVTNYMRKDLLNANPNALMINTSNFYLDKNFLDESWDIYVKAVK